MTDEDAPNLGGRPTAFRAECVEQARKLAQLGATDREIADFFEVTDRTLRNWKHAHPDFADALKLGKDAADDRVERSLYHKAVGYTFNSKKILAVNGVVERVPVVEHVPPSDTACIFWLKNRRRDEWRDKQDHEVTGRDGAAIETKATLDISGLSDEQLRVIAAIRIKPE